MIIQDIGLQELEASEPWLVDQRSFYPSDDRKIISEHLQELNENHAMLTLVTAHGTVYSDVFLTEVDRVRVKLEKPLDWEENGDAFRIFYRDPNDHWCLIYSCNVSTGPSSITLDMPGRLFYMQRRRFKRTKAPAGTRAMIKNISTGMITTVDIIDISAAGMLFYEGASADNYPVNAFVENIIISITDKQEKRGKTSFGSRRLFPFIRMGRVVRTSVDKEKRRIYYGVSFECDSVYMSEGFTRMISGMALCT